MPRHGRPYAALFHAIQKSCWSAAATRAAYGYADYDAALLLRLSRHAATLMTYQLRVSGAMSEEICALRRQSVTRYTGLLLFVDAYY